MDMSEDSKSYQDRITSSLVNITKTASQISTQDVAFHRSASDHFSDALDQQSAHLLQLTAKLLRVAAKDTSVKAPALRNREDVEDNWRGVVDVVDDILEAADRSLDEFTGVIKRLSPTRQEGPEPPTKRLKQGHGLDPWSQNNILKPQLLFERKVDNYDTSFWKPLLMTKPHANMPLEDSIGKGEAGFKHPYAHEIQNMIYPSSVYSLSEPMSYTPPEESQPIFVDTENAVQEMLSELKSAKEIAIDLEHNDKNSYLGMVCLMQISIRDKDWIVDTLKPWRERLQVLNEVFANPRIIKILHGSTSDIIWLQRDLGLYIVGLFDTYHASNVLQFPSKSLKYLLQRFADFEAQKQYQLADWRVRPLPQELIDYARSDTHFLLYIYDNLRNMLVEASTPRENLVELVLDSSRREALQIYERPVYDKEAGLNQGGWMRLLLQRSSHLTNEQLGVFRAIHEWRDSKARELDEGEQNIMPNTLIWTIAETMPTYRGAFFQRGAGRLPRYVAENLPEIIEVVKQGMAEGKTGPSVHELIEKHSQKAGFMFGRNKYVRKKAEDPNRGVGNTLQMLNNSGELHRISPTDPSAAVATPPSEVIATEAGISQLWGSVQPQVPPSFTNFSIITQALESILPFQGLLQTPFATVEKKFANTEPVAQMVPTASHQAMNGESQVESKDEVFILRDRSRKRKVSETMAPEDPADIAVSHNGNGIVSNAIENPASSLDPQAQKRQQQKQARKAEKKAKKAAQAHQQADAQANVVPFDYANADSMLYAKTDPSELGIAPDGKAKDKPLNPFMKALDTSTGARRNKMSKELAGKSHTFRG